MNRVRLYGVSMGEASFARVTDGMKWALEELGELAGFVPVDLYDNEGVYPGHDAEIGVFVGPPAAIPMMSSIGWHKRRLALLPANSTWMPARLVETAAKYLTGFIAPSEWAAVVLRSYTELEVSVWQHGVCPTITNPGRHAALAEMYDGWTPSNNVFKVGHLASTHMERKGTKELVRAWCACVKNKQLGREPYLYIYSDHHRDFYMQAAREASDGDERVLETIHGFNRVNLPTESMSSFYEKFHLIAQPSRGEGFGLVPLEARACGIPVLMTACTGHSEHVFDGRRGDDIDLITVETNGVRIVKTGFDAYIDDGPGAMAPSLAAQDVEEALASTYRHWTDMHETSVVHAPTINKQWSWIEVTRKWLAAQGESK